MFEKDPVEKKKQKDKIEKETFPKFLKQMLAILQQSPGAYLVGNDVRNLRYFITPVKNLPLYYLGEINLNYFSDIILITDDLG